MNLPVRETGLPKGRPWFPAFLSLAGLGPFFFSTYLIANWVTSQRAYVPSIVFGWERGAPFLPWTIVPYWTSDLLYGLSLLVCATRSELGNQVKRLVTLQLISVTCFLAFPLRCVFQRPEIHGAFGWMFDVLLGFDQPFNQAPSLHVSLAVILWSRFSRHLQGIWRSATAAWLVLVALSTMTTYQHQFIDLPTGLMAGLLTIALVREGRLNRRGQRFRLAILYGSGAMLVTAIACGAGGFGWVLLWPALALLAVASIYLADCPGAFRQPLVRLIASPYIAAAWINSRWWTRGEAVAHEIADGVWLGRAPGRFEGASIVNVAAELKVDARGKRCMNIPMLDLVIPTREQLNEAVAAVESFAAQRPTLVCCALGYSRSAAVVAAWLLSTRRARSLEEAVARIRERRPRVVVDGMHG